MRIWQAQTHHTTPISNQLSQIVSIIDPAHALYGQSLPLVSRVSPRGKDQLIVRLANGQNRSIPKRVTDLEAESKPVTAASLAKLRQKLPWISAYTLLPLAELVQAKLRSAREVTHARSPEPSVKAKPSSAIPNEADAVAATQPEPATATSTTPGGTHPTAASCQRKRRHGGEG